MGPDAKSFEDTTNSACDRLMALAGSLLDAPPRDSFVDRLANAGHGTDRQALLDLIVISIFGGGDTTRAQLAFAAWIFSQHPDQWSWLRNNPDHVTLAVDEVIRMRPTTTWASREALEAMEIDGVTIGKGDTVHVLVHATGTDPATGHDGCFDIRRLTKTHFGFGGGAHHCLGHFVARTDMTAALRVMLRRWQRIHLAGEAQFLPDSGNTSPLALPLRIEAA
jgi:cytochrome P450